MQTKTLYTVVAWIAFPSFVKRECAKHVLSREQTFRSGVGVVSLEVCGRQTGTRKEYRYGWELGLATSIETVFSAELEIRAQERRSGSCKGWSECYVITRRLANSYGGHG